MIRSLDDCIKRYGQIVNGVWVNEPKWCIGLQIPIWIGGNWINSTTGLPVIRLYVNRDMADPLLRALQNVYDFGLVHELKTFDGTYHIRDVRGEPGKLSTHAYALAIDINASENPLGGESKFSDAFICCFIVEGFSWGGRFSRKDPQHFSRAWE